MAMVKFDDALFAKIRSFTGASSLGVVFCTKRKVVANYTEPFRELSREKSGFFQKNLNAYTIRR